MTRREPHVTLADLDELRTSEGARAGDKVMPIAGRILEGARELGCPEPPLITVTAMGWRNSWETVPDDMKARYQAEGLLQPCPLCRGQGAMSAAMVGSPTEPAGDDTVLVTQDCPVCERLGHLPTKRLLRKLTDNVAAHAAEDQQRVAEVAYVHGMVQQLLDGDIPQADCTPGVLRVQPKEGEPYAGEIIDLATADKARLVAVRDIAAAEIEEIRERATMHDRVRWEFEQLATLVQNAQSIRKWLDRVSEATHAWVAAQAVAAQADKAKAPAAAPRCQCGKPGTVEQPGGAWLCKRCAYAAGAIEHTAAALREVADMVACDWCERHPAVREHDGFHYCRTCADEAQLPPVAA